jgi:CheY-like chemotaxis protein
VADDDADLRQVLVQLLEHKGYNVVEAGDGGAALEYLAGAADGDGAMPDAILLDFAMPELSGIGIIRTLRRFVCVPPTILMTGFPDIHVDAFAHAVGIETILHKPLDAEQLLRVLDQVIVARGERNALLREREREPTSS